MSRLCCGFLCCGFLSCHEKVMSFAASFELGHSVKAIKEGMGIRVERLRCEWARGKVWATCFRGGADRLSVVY